MKSGSRVQFSSCSKRASSSRSSTGSDEEPGVKVAPSRRPNSRSESDDCAIAAMLSSSWLHCSSRGDSCCSCTGVVPTTRYAGRCGAKLLLFPVTSGMWERRIDARSAQRVLSRSTQLLVAIRKAWHWGHRHRCDAAFARWWRQLLRGRCVRRVVHRRPERCRHAHNGHPRDESRSDDCYRHAGSNQCGQRERLVRRRAFWKSQARFQRLHAHRHCAARSSSPCAVVLTGDILLQAIVLYSIEIMYCTV